MLDTIKTVRATLRIAACLKFTYKSTNLLVVFVFVYKRKK